MVDVVTADATTPPPASLTKSPTLNVAAARVETNEGNVWEADVSETYFFDLDGKISSVTQYAKPVSSTEDSE